MAAPSRTQSSSTPLVVPRKRFLTLFITTVVVISLLAASGYVDYSQSQSAQNLNNQISNYLSEIAGLKVNITLLKNQVASLQTTIAGLNSQIASLNSQIALLNSQISALQTQLAALRAPKLIGNFTFGNSCPIVGNCTYTADGAYGNVGTLTATAASVTFDWFSMPSYSGTLLCSVRVDLGDVAGRSISILPTQSCSGTSPTLAQSMAYQFHMG